MYGRKKRKSSTPWKRDAKPASYTADDINYIRNFSSKRPKFYIYEDNRYLNAYTKRSTLRVSKSVVSLTSFSGDRQVFEASGTIIESNDTSSIILTSADLLSSSDYENPALKILVHLWDSKCFEGHVLSFDLHYNVAVVEIQPGAPLEAASLRLLDDSLTMDPTATVVPGETPFQLRRHSEFYNITPRDKVIAMGRYFLNPHDLMAAPGMFRINPCEEHDCKELFRTNCKITRCGVGGPLINCHGEVIGVCFYNMFYTPFLPINLATKWWHRCKEGREIRRPLLPMEFTNLCAASIEIVEKKVHKFPNTFKGVIVEEVEPGSYAESAGIEPNDVIVQFGGKTINGFLELVEKMWDTVGKPTKCVVLRGNESVRVPLSMVVDEATPDKFYSWPSLEKEL